MSDARSERSAAATFLREIWTSLGGEPARLHEVSLTGSGDLPSVFAVSDLAAGVIAAAGLAVTELMRTRGSTAPKVRVDRRLASFWFQATLRPDGWSVPPPWDPIAGDYAAADGWIRLHTNAPHHRKAALSVLDVDAEKSAVAKAVSAWRIDDLEAAVVQRGGCAAAMRGLADWASHPQGTSVAGEPLAWLDDGDPVSSQDWAPSGDWAITPDRPLAGIRVLDLTRVLAGPVATRFLAGFGADVLRIDPPDWDDPV